MALDDCLDCPNTCFGNTLSSDCVVHGGRSLKTYLEGLSGEPDSTSSSPASDVTTDDIMSKSLIRDTSNVCASKIIKRDFEHSLAATAVGTTFSWNLGDVRKQLPSGYRVALARIQATGADSTGQRNVLIDSQSAVGGFPLNPDAYPVTVDILLRVTSPCGDIDLTKTITLINSSKTGTFKAFLNARDLNPQAGEINLTDQLNMLEDKVVSMEAIVDSLPDPSVQLSLQEQSIASLQDSVSSLGSIDFDYVKNGAQQTDSLSVVINDIYAQIKSINDKLLTHDIQIESLQAQIDSLNS